MYSLVYHRTIYIALLTYISLHTLHLLPCTTSYILYKILSFQHIKMFVFSGNLPIWAHLSMLNVHIPVNAMFSDSPDTQHWLNNNFAWKSSVTPRWTTSLRFLPNRWAHRSALCLHLLWSVVWSLLRRGSSQYDRGWNRCVSTAPVQLTR